jgi:histidyl-tRNA synthetase
MSTVLHAVRGMNDILPDEAERWERLEDTLRCWLQSYGYRNIRTPLVEYSNLFKRAIGESTDIVEKEMYSFEDVLNGEHLTLRPEATASTVRAAIQHSLMHPGPQRLYYLGPMYRHERPQRGRYRQFHQVGAEAIGFSGPDVDAEQLLMCSRLWGNLGLTGIRLELNCLGSQTERKAYRDALVKYLEGCESALDEDSRRRLLTNPLRVLDSKVQSTRDLMDQAPVLLEFLGDASLKHFDGVQAILKDIGIEYSINTRLVRGLDYYNLTVFEWISDKLGAQGTVCGGGRYDGLFEQIGSKPVSACGWAMGIERLLALMEEEGVRAAPDRADVYLVNQGDHAQLYAFRVAEKLRSAGFRVTQHCGGGSFKSQMKKADSSGACLAVILGDDEVRSSEVTIKPLRQRREQFRVMLEGLSESVSTYLAENKVNLKGDRSQ